MKHRRMFARLMVAGAVALAAGGATAGSAMAASGGSTLSQTKAAVTVVVQQTRATSDLLVYEVRVTNRGGGPAKNAVLALPYAGAGLKLLDVSYNLPGAWTSATRDGALEIQTGRIASGAKPVVATVRFSRLAAGAALTERVSYEWLDYGSGGRGASNLPNEALADAAGGIYALSAAIDGRDVIFSGSAFVPNEPVTFWYSNAAGEVFPLEVKGDRLIEAAVTRDGRGEEGHSYASASGAGAIEMEWIAKRLPAGAYALVARGNWSGLTATAPFVLR